MQNKEELAHYDFQDYFTPYEAACLILGYDPKGFMFGGPSPQEETITSALRSYTLQSKRAIAKEANMSSFAEVVAASGLLASDDDILSYEEVTQFLIGKNKLHKAHYFHPRNNAALSNVENQNNQAELQRLQAKVTELEADKTELEQLRLRVDELKKENASLKAGGAVNGGLVFPYSTPELKAMLDAVNIFWRNHTTDKRQPTQKEVGMKIMEHLGQGLPSSGEVPNKAKALATSIQPEKYRA